MSDKELTQKVADLTEAVQTEHAKVSKSIKVAAIIYGLLVIFVFAYTSYVTSQIKEMATPKTVAVMVSDMAKGQIPQFKQYLVDNTKAQAPVWAENIVNYAHDSIPTAKNIAKEQMNSIAEQLIIHVKDEYLPQLTDYLINNIDSAFKKADIVSNEEMAQGISHVMVEHIEKELNKIIHDKFIMQLHDFRKEVEVITAKPAKKLTKKEAAERKVIMYWLFLVKYGDTGKSKFVDFLKFSSNFLKHVKDPAPDGTIEKEKPVEEDQ